MLERTACHQSCCNLLIAIISFATWLQSDQTDKTIRYNLCEGYNPGEQNLTAKIYSTWMINLDKTNSSLNLQAENTADLLDTYVGIGINRIIESAQVAYIKLIMDAHKYNSCPEAAILPCPEANSLDAALLAGETAFWLTHWLGAWVGEHMMSLGDVANVTHLISELYACSLLIEFNSLSHGITWHYMAKLQWGSFNVIKQARLFCFPEMSFYVDCFHGIGHGIVHSLLLSSRNLTYSYSSQLYRVCMSPAEYDAAAAICSAFEFIPASGCADGVTHSYFNYLPFERFPAQWASWCADRLWPPFCYRNMLQYGPLSLFGVPKVGTGRETQIEWLSEFVGALPSGMVGAADQLSGNCLQLSYSFQASCVYGIVLSSWSKFLINLFDMCRQFVGHSTRLVCSAAAFRLNGTMCRRENRNTTGIQSDFPCSFGETLWGAKRMAQSICPKGRCDVAVDQPLT